MLLAMPPFLVFMSMGKRIVFVVSSPGCFECSFVHRTATFFSSRLELTAKSFIVRHVLMCLRLENRHSLPFYIQFSSRIELERKQVDDVLGGAEAWKNVDSTDGTS